MTHLDTRVATQDDYDFLFELKKAAEYDAIKAVFGWDETVQKSIHQQEWREDTPTIIEIENHRAGSFLLQYHQDHLYFGRFFLLPHYHGQGIGSQILDTVVAISTAKQLPIRLCYLQGNRVGGLYRRYGFEVTSQDSQFIHMQRPVTS